MSATASTSSAKYGVIIGVFLVICLLDFLVSNLPTFLDMGLVAVATAGGVLFGRKTSAWF